MTSFPFSPHLSPMLRLAPRPRPQTPPPARRWRNYYRVYRVLDLDRLGAIFPGVHAGPDGFPSTPNNTRATSSPP